MSKQQQSLEQQWQAIEHAGGRYQYVQQQLNEKGFLVARKNTDRMSKSELERYKKALKEEAKAKRQLQKETWQAYKANHVVYLGDGIYWTDDTSEDKWDVKDASKRLVENQLPTFKQAQDVARYFELSMKELKMYSFQRDVATWLPYTQFTIAKKTGGERQIWAPHSKLKQTQRKILDNILNPLMIHGSAHGFVRGKSIATNAEQHTNSRFIIKLDIQDFFPSIHWRRVKGVFRHAGYSQPIATLLALLCTESPRQTLNHQGKTCYVALGERCLPQGAPTSPALTNIICLNLDRRLTGLAEKLGLRYSRYADDLTFSQANASKPSDDESTLIAQLLGSISKILQEEGFQLHHKKTKIIRQSNCQSVTGLVVNGQGTPRVPREIKRKIRAVIHNLQHGKSLHKGESIHTYIGYASWVAMTEPELGKMWIAQLHTLADAYPHLYA